MRLESEAAMKAKNSSGNSGAPSTRGKAVAFEDFEPDREMSFNHRAAQFLDWCAIHMPGRFVPYTWIARHMHMLTRTPTSKTKEVIEIRKSKMDSIKRILWNEYDRRTLSVPRDLIKAGQEPGVRATTDSDDLTQHAYLRQTKRVASAARSAQDTRQKIDVDSMRNGDLKALVERTDPVLKQLARADLMKRLELPAHNDDDD
jgi:hypothetical protein